MIYFHPRAELEWNTQGGDQKEVPYGAKTACQDCWRDGNSLPRTVQKSLIRRMSHLKRPLDSSWKWWHCNECLAEVKTSLNPRKLISIFYWKLLLIWRRMAWTQKSKSLEADRFFPKLRVWLNIYDYRTWYVQMKYDHIEVMRKHYFRSHDEFNVWFLYDY